MPVLFTLLLIFVLNGVAVAGPSVSAVEVAYAGGAGRIELVTGGSVTYKMFTLSKPHRLVVDLSDTRLATALPSGGYRGTPIIRARSGYREQGRKLRLVFELAQALHPEAELRGDRLRIALSVPHGARTRVAEATPKAPVRTVDQVASDNGLREVVVAIDAGHGGKDVGAEGPSGVYEKDVVLAVAKRLQWLIEKERGMRPVMIREGDQFLRLRERINRARELKADLFISLHANSYQPDPRVGGASVYVLSNRGASSEAARLMAQRENEADLIGGVSLEETDEELGAVLLDLAQNATLEDSIVAADEVLGELKRRGKVHKRQVERAGFLVLKSPDIPSMLVELAFISNPEEERNLTDPNHQYRLAVGLLQGVRGYFAKSAPPGTLLAEENRRLRTARR